MEGLIDWCGFLLSYHLGIYNEDFTYFNIDKVCINLTIVLLPMHIGSTYHARTFNIHRQNCPSISLVYNDIELTNNSCTQKFSHLDILIEHQHLTSIRISDSTSRFFDTIIDVDYLCPSIHLYIPAHAFTTLYMGYSLWSHVLLSASLFTMKAALATLPYPCNWKAPLARQQGYDCPVAWIAREQVANRCWWCGRHYTKYRN